MLIIDGVKYEEWIPKSEEEFEEIIKEHAKDIFGEDSIFFDLKKKLKTRAGIGSIPDGYVISFREPPCWYICEVELHTHLLYEHIVPQMTKFINGVKSFETQREIINALDREISGDPLKEALVRSKIGPVEVYRFISDLISKLPILVIVIDQKTKELEEVCDSLPIEVKIVELKTFTREGIGLAVHAHLFELLHQPPPKKIIITEVAKEEITVTHKVEGRVKIQHLIDADIIEPGQVIYGWRKGKKYEARIMPDGKIKLLHNGNEYNSPSAAGKGILGHEIDGWFWWLTTRENGRECKLDELRKEFESNLSP